MKSTFALAVSSLVVGVLSETHQVVVGPGLSYSPDTVTANEGDTIDFTFPSGHDVVSGAFDSPCQPDGVIYSGMPTDSQTFSVTINSTDTIWIYCSVQRHCENGMVMVINPGSDHTLDDYRNAASSASSSSAPDEVTGGSVGDSSASSATSSGASAATSSASSVSSAATSTATNATGTASGTGSATGSAATATSTGSSASTYRVSSVIAGLTAIMGLLVIA